MSLSQGYLVVKALFLPVLNYSGSDCTIVTLISAAIAISDPLQVVQTCLAAVALRHTSGACWAG